MLGIARDERKAPMSTEPAPCPLWRRLVALVYDLLIVVAIVMVVGLVCQLVTGGKLIETGAHAVVPLWYQLLQGVVVAAYFVASWRRGGQTLGMRPWRLKVTGADDQAPGWKALWLRYAVGTLSLAAAGLGFWWAWFDRDRLTWHDRASGTRTVRLPKRKK